MAEPFFIGALEMRELMKRGDTVKELAGFDHLICGIAVNKAGTMFAVAEEGMHRVSLFTKERKKIRSFGTLGTEKGQLTAPHGVAFTNDGHNILVTDNHRLQKFTLEGQCLKSVGSGDIGTKALEFNGPSGIAIHPTTGQIYVADRCNHRIQVINENFTFSHFIDGSKSALGRIRIPWDAAFDNKRRLYVTNMGDECVDVFTTSGEHIRRFGGKGAEKGQLEGPAFIVVDTNLLYVTEMLNHRISVFGTDGNFIRHIGHRGSREGEFNHPRGLAKDKSDPGGEIYVCDGNKKVVIF